MTSTNSLDGSGAAGGVIAGGGGSIGGAGVGVGGTGDLDEEQLLTVLTNGSTGRNPTFFKAYGHEDVFGLKAAIPAGAATVSLTDPAVMTNGGDLNGAGSAACTTADVLYVQLPDGHPVITGNGGSDESSTVTPPQAMPELSIEEAIEQAEIIFDDGSSLASLGASNTFSSVAADSAAPTFKTVCIEEKSIVKDKPTEEVISEQQLVVKMDTPEPPTKAEDDRPNADQEVKENKNDVSSMDLVVSCNEAPKETGMNVVKNDKAVEVVEDDVIVIDEIDAAASTSPAAQPPPKSATIAAAAANSNHHNLRPKRTLRHVHALKQQAKRRKRNANVAASSAVVTSGAAAAATNASSPAPVATPNNTSPALQRICKKQISPSNGGKFNDELVKPLFVILARAGARWLG